MSGRIKYPRTPHLPWSPGGTSDDAYLVDTSHFIGREVVVTEKMDGENTSLYSDGMHARSLDSRHHPSRDWVKSFQASICQDIPRGWRLCGENVYALHSVAYEHLESYFLLFSIWDEENVCLSWDQPLEWAKMIGVTTVPEMWRGEWDEGNIREITIDESAQEGYVVRLVESYSYDRFRESVGKWVRPHHVQTDQHWMNAPVVPNGLKKEEG